MPPAEHGEHPAAPPCTRRRVGVLLDALYNEYASMLVTASAAVTEFMSVQHDDIALLVARYRAPP